MKCSAPSDILPCPLVAECSSPGCFLDPTRVVVAVDIWNPVPDAIVAIVAIVADYIMTWALNDVVS